MNRDIHPYSKWYLARSLTALDRALELMMRESPGFPGEPTVPQTSGSAQDLSYEVYASMIFSRVCRGRAAFNYTRDAERLPMGDRSLLAHFSPLGGDSAALLGQLVCVDHAIVQGDFLRAVGRLEAIEQDVAPEDRPEEERYHPNGALLGATPRWLLRRLDGRHQAWTNARMGRVCDLNALRTSEFIGGRRSIFDLHAA